MLKRWVPVFAKPSGFRRPFYEPAGKCIFLAPSDSPALAVYMRTTDREMTRRLHLCQKRSDPAANAHNSFRFQASILKQLIHINGHEYCPY